MATNDRPKVHDTLAALDVEGGDREPYTIALKGNKRITFPDPADMPWDEAEELVSGLADDHTTLDETFKRWLSDKDYATLKEAKLTLRQIQAVGGRVQAYYSDILGTQGEGTGSTLS